MSDISEKIDLNKTLGEERQLPCSRCDNRTYHKVLVSVNIYVSESGFDSWEEYEVVQCQGCRTISFRENRYNSEDMIEVGPGEIAYEEHQTLYPNRLVGRPRLAHGIYLPQPIRIIYDETHSALCNKLPVLTGVGIRALIEAVCKDKSAKGRDLKEKIDDLVAIGVLTKEGADILHSLRGMGNSAAHEVTPHSERELNTAFDVVEHLLVGVYILPAKAKKLPKGNISP